MMYYMWYIPRMASSEKVLVIQFFQLTSGREPVRDWIKTLPQEDRKLIGHDLMAVELGWPCGPPLCAPLTDYPGLYEVRSSLTGRRIARVFFSVSERTMVLLHGFIKKTQASPMKDLKLAARRLKVYDSENQVKEKKKAGRAC